MTTFGWSYKKNFSGSQPGAVVSKLHKKTSDTPSMKTIGDTANIEQKFRGSLESRLYIGGLAWKTTEAELKHYFAAFGEIVDLRIITDKETGFSRGFGFVTFDSRAVAEACKKWCSGNSPMISDRLIHVEFAERHSNRQPRDKGDAPGQASSATAAAQARERTDGTQPSPAASRGLSVKKCYWQYKWTKDSEQCYGPYPTANIQGWQNGKFFTSAVVVREVDPYEYNEIMKKDSIVNPDALSGEYVPLNEIDFSMFP